MNSLKFKEAKERFQPSKWTKYFLIFSVAVILAGAIVFAVIGFNLGMDFTGGNVVRIQSTTEIPDAEYNQIISQTEEIFTGIDSGLSISRSQTENDTTNGSYYISIQYQNLSSVSDMTEINNEIVTALTEAFPNYTIINAETISASASTDLLINALLAVFIALIFILIYIAIRFEFLSGIAAMLTLFHDVLIMCACVAIFRIEVNSSFIAAIITILGYSINNTIVVFDRVRENLKKPSLDNLSNMQIADLSIKQTLNRTLNTSITTIMAIFLLALIGVPDMTEFVVPILIGLIAGTYASIFISAPLWAKMMSKTSKYGIRQKAKEKENAKALQENEEGVVDAVATPAQD